MTVHRWRPQSFVVFFCYLGSFMGIFAKLGQNIYWAYSRSHSRSITSKEIVDIRLRPWSGAGPCWIILSIRRSVKSVLPPVESL